MNFFKSLKLQFKPPKMTDPDFGPLTYMHIARDPARSYWEAEWRYPPTGTPVAIGLEGDESGPRPAARNWHLKLPARFPLILERARGELERVFRDWLDQELPADILSVVKLSGFGIEDPVAQPERWEVSFETTGSKWLGITIPFVGEEPGQAVVDT